MILAVFLAMLTFGMLPSRSSLRRHTARQASATALSELASDTGGCFEYLMTVQKQTAWRYRFHAESSRFYIKHLGARRTRAEALLELAAWEPAQDMQQVVDLLRWERSSF